VIRETGSQTRVGLSVLSAPAAGLLAAGLVSFVLMFVGAVMRHGGHHPPLHLMIGFWVLILLASVAAAGWAARRSALGPRDLVIDEGDRTVTFTPPWWREGPSTLPLNAITGVEVEEKTPSNPKSQVATYAPTLVIASPAGEPKRVALVEWIDRPRAESFADWLRHKLRLTPPPAGGGRLFNDITAVPAGADFPKSGPNRAR
jgi:hypothetical protein